LHSGESALDSQLPLVVYLDADKTCIATFGYPVGGVVVPVDRLGLAAPWMGLVTLAAVVGVLLRAQRRK
jgi:hypothetical protein